MRASPSNCATEKVYPAKLSSESSDRQARLAYDSTIACDAPSVKIDAVYREHHPAVLRYLKSQIRDKHLAEDLAQEVFIVAFRQREPVLNWRNFLSRAARLRVREARSGRHSLAAKSLPEGFDAPECRDTEDAFPGNLANELAKSLTKLTDNERRLYQMYYVDGATAKSIATQLGKAPSTVLNTLMTVRKKLSVPN